MKIYLIILILFSSNIFCQNIDLKLLKENSIYFVSRSTKLKSSIIANKFNIKDDLITHTGIGFKFKDDGFKIYNVSNSKKNLKKSSLIKESLVEYISEDEVTYYSIWKLELSIEEVNLVLKTIDTFYSSFKVKFDYDFNLDTNKELYCSEFIYKLLKRNKIHIKHLNPTQKNFLEFTQVY
jgi:hypothetical protein